MMGHTHFTFGALFAAVAVNTGHAEPTVAFFLGSLIGSLAPDLDHPQAMLSKKIPLSGATIGFLRHRTLTHSLVGLAIAYSIGKYLVPLLLSKLWSLLMTSLPGQVDTLLQIQDLSATYFGSGFLWGFMLGYISHIFIDLFNPMGVQLFYPFEFLPNRGWVNPPFGLGIGTGTIWELMFAVVSLLITTYVSPMTGLSVGILVFIFWYLIGKPGLPRYRL